MMRLSKQDSLALKGIAILMMYIHHFYLSPDRWSGCTVDFFPLTADMTVYIAQFFKICVSIFVFITGYGMTQSLRGKQRDLPLDSQNILSYTKHRLWSLLSNFIFVYVLVILITFPTGRFFEIYGRSSSSILYIIIDMFGLAKLFKTPSFVGTWWYMSLAIVLIVLFPLLIKLYQQYRWLLVFAILLLPRFFNLKVANTNLLHYLFAIVLGIYCAQSDCFTRWKEFESTHFHKIPKPILFMFHLLILLALVIFRQCPAGQEVLEVFDGIIPVYIAYFGLRYILGPGSQNCVTISRKAFDEYVLNTYLNTYNLLPGFFLRFWKCMAKCISIVNNHHTNFYRYRIFKKTIPFL